MPTLASSTRRSPLAIDQYTTSAPPPRGRTRTFASRSSYAPRSSTRGPRWSTTSGTKSTTRCPSRFAGAFPASGLLEIADQEFVSIRCELATSRDEARATLAKSGALPIDLVSLDALIRQPEVEALDQVVALGLSTRLGETPFFPDYLVKLLRLAGLETTKDVVEAIAAHGPAVKGSLAKYFEFARRSLGFSAESIEEVQRGYSLLFVALLSVIRADALAINKVARLTRLYLETDFPGDERKAQRIAGELVTALQQ